MESLLNFDVFRFFLFHKVFFDKFQCGRLFCIKFTLLEWFRLLPLMYCVVMLITLFVFNLDLMYCAVMLIT